METKSQPGVKAPRSATASPPRLEVHLGYWMRLVSNRVSDTFAGLLHKRQLSVAEWVALNLVDRGTEVTPAGLADAMGMTRGAISKVLAKLESKRWITREASPRDSRVQWVSPTRAGSRMLPELELIADENDAHFFGVLSADERATLRKLLQKLAEVHGMNVLPVA